MAFERNIAPVFGNGASGYIDGSLNAPGYILNKIAYQSDGKIVAIGNGRLFRFNADGSRDTALGGDGVLALRLGPDGAIGWTDLTDITPLPDGKILITGSVSVNMTSPDDTLVVARLNADGSLDSTFKDGGKVVINPSTKTSEKVVGTAILDDGRILVAAASVDIVGTGTSSTSPQHISLARFMPDGTPDASFGINGISVGNSSNARPAHMVVQADGKILVVASDTNSKPGYYDLMLFRYNSDGTPDKSFGVGGSLKTGFASSTYNVSSQGLRIAVQADGKIVAVGSAPPQTNDERLQSGFAVVRYNANGSLDTTFSGDGKFNEFVWPDNGTWRPEGDRGWGRSVAHDLHLADDGSIVVAGRTFGDEMNEEPTREQFAMIRLRADGSFDKSFGMNGYVTTAAAPGTLSDYINFANMLVGPDGRIVIGGAVNVIDTGHHVFMVGFKPDGTLDDTFGTSAPGTQNNAVYLSGHPDQFLHARIQIDSPYVDDFNGATFEGAQLTLARLHGANAEDNFIAGGALQFADGRAILDGVDVGGVVVHGGVLVIDFNENATKARVNHTLQSIAYDNKRAQTAQQVEIDWTFSDGTAAARFTTLVSVQPVEVPYWIDAFLDRRSDSQTADQLRALLQSFAGDGKNLAVKFDVTGSGVLSTGQRQLVEGVLGDIESMVGINFGTTGTPLSIKNSTELDAGEGAATPLSRSGAGAYVALLEDGDTYANSGIVLHALAHALGLKDGDLPSANGSVLPFRESAEPFTVTGNGGENGEKGTFQHMGPLDVAALQFLYGPNKLARAGNDIYRLSEDAGNFIWDGAGTDTVSGEDLSADITLHLEPGHWDFTGSQGRYITDAGQFTVNYGSVIENAIGGSGNDNISGNSIANTLTGGAGNDRFEGLGSNDRIDGGVGTDTAVFNGLRSAYTVKQAGTGFTVTDRLGSGGTDTLINTERIQFKDGMVAIDLDGSAGQVYRLYRAAFAREPDSAGLGYWIAAMDKGMSADNVAELFMASAEFAAQYGAQPDSTRLITTLYKNVLHREPDPDGFAWWLGLLDNATISATDALSGFSESEENRAQVIGEIQDGIAFTPFHG